MASTTTVNGDYCSMTIGKSLTPQSALTSKIKTAILCVAFDSCCNYASCGVVVDLSADGRIKTIITAQVVGGLPDGLVAKYEPDTCPANCATSGTLKVFQSSTCMAPLVELCDMCTDLDCQTIKFQVTGF